MRLSMKARVQYVWRELLMIIKSLHLENFRSYRDASIEFDEHLTTIVGENNTGKSSIGWALSRILGGSFGGEDFPYYSLSRTVGSVSIPFSSSDIRETHGCISTPMSPGTLQDSCRNELSGSKNFDRELRVPNALGP